MSTSGSRNPGSSTWGQSQAVTRIDARTVAALVAAGRLNTTDPARAVAALAEFRHADWRESPEWAIATARLGPAAFSSLVRALTLAEHHFWTHDQVSGSSVSCVIWAYLEFEHRYPERAHELGDWMVRHTRSYYLLRRIGHSAEFEIFEQLRAMPPSERLQRILIGARPLEWYPDEFAELSRNEIAEFDDELRSELSRKMGGRRRGP